MSLLLLTLPYSVHWHSIGSLEQTWTDLMCFLPLLAVRHGRLSLCGKRHAHQLHVGNVGKTNESVIHSLPQRLLVIAFILPVLPMSHWKFSLFMINVFCLFFMVFASNTVGLSHIVSVQRGKCNALDCIKDDLFNVVYPFVKAFVLLNAHAYIYTI